MQHRERIALEKICAEIDLALKFPKMRLQIKKILE